MAQIRAPRNNLRNNLRDRGRHGRRVDRFLDERRDRERPRRNNGRNDREREDEHHERRAQDLRDDDENTLKDYLLHRYQAKMQKAGWAYGATSTELPLLGRRYIQTVW